MAYYTVSFRVEGKTYYTQGNSTYPSDEAIDKNDIDMDMAYFNAAVFASAERESRNLKGIIEPGSIKFQVYKK